ncbi:MAG: alpha/beta fold hydrolase [bacterium]
MSSTNDWIDPSRFPFESNRLAVSGGQMHYVDQGSGTPVLFLHGNPTWSFMYRDAITELMGRHRCIAPDHLGFGLSDKPQNWGYRPWQHATNIARLIQNLGLERFHLVVHDWGGPIGISVAQDFHDQVDSITVLNSWMWPLDSSWKAQFFSRFLGSFAGRYLIRHWGLFEKWMMPQGVSNRSRFDGDIHRHYLKPFEGPSDRNGIWRFPTDILQAGKWLENLWKNRRVLEDIPALFLWGLEDPAFTREDLERWRGLFNRQSVRTFEKASHYVMEDAGQQVAVRLARFLTGVGS